MNAVVAAAPDNYPQPRNEGATILSVISRAAADPNCDIEKMERLMQMHERIQERQAAADFAADLAEMQDALPSIGERGNAAGRYTYALWEDINAAIKPIMKQYGFALSFRTDFSDGIAVTGVLSHKGGHREETTIKLPADASGNKNAVQAVASSVSYGKRYTAGALLNLTSHGEDDDAFTASTGFDITSWADAIKDAMDKDDLDRIAADLRTKTGIPAPAMRQIRALWAARAKEVKA
ncbi:ERF family protein [Stenotrophomonas sp. CW117]|uniref:ERF family protein n=1 Tax=Stenotrophomonas TaxID=40323 RepID=UPI0009EA7811|nr:MULTISPECIES: ERF family protein [Stenotrophomonas]QOF97475.1 ERF family protein [Stenotrophomonas sp. CW117]